MNKISELFGLDCKNSQADFKDAIKNQNCPFTCKSCIKTRKSNADIKIGTCTVKYKNQDIIICPNRFLQKNTIFENCIPLLQHHKIENKLYLIPEVQIPGGQVDYFLVSANGNKVEDFLGIEIQSIDTTGSVWAERQRFLSSIDIEVDNNDINTNKTFSMNWKMTLKTILIQMLHKSHVFEQIQKNLVLIVQQPLLEFMSRDFQVENLKSKASTNFIHIHSCSLIRKQDVLELSLNSQFDTNSECISKCIYFNNDKSIRIETINNMLEKRLKKDENLLHKSSILINTIANSSNSFL